MFLFCFAVRLIIRCLTRNEIKKCFFKDVEKVKIKVFKKFQTNDLFFF